MIDGARIADRRAAVDREAAVPAAVGDGLGDHQGRRVQTIPLATLGVRADRDLVQVAADLDRPRRQRATQVSCRCFQAPRPCSRRASRARRAPEPDHRPRSQPLIDRCRAVIGHTPSGLAAPSSRPASRISDGLRLRSTDAAAGRLDHRDGQPAKRSRLSRTGASSRDNGLGRTRPPAFAGAISSTIDHVEPGAARARLWLSRPCRCWRGQA